METLKKIVKNEYFPAAAVLVAVVLFWVIAMLGGLSLLNNNQPPMATLTWLLFVYAAAVLTPLAGVLAAINLVRRWQRNRQYAQAVAGVQHDVDLADEPETAAEPAAVPKQPAPNHQSTNHQPTNHQPAQSRPAKSRPTKSQPLKKPAQSKQRKKAA